MIAENFLKPNTNMELSEKNKKERFDFAESIRSIGLNRCVFLGQCKFGSTTLWCAVTNLRESKFFIDYGGINSEYYAGFLEEDVLPIWNAISNLTVVHMKGRLTKSNLVKNWISDHPNIKFVEWPRIMKDIYPLNYVWPYFNDVDVDDETSIYDRWDLLKEDLNDFRHMYTNVSSQIRKIVWSGGAKVDSDSDGESGIDDDDSEGFEQNSDSGMY